MIKSNDYIMAVTLFIDGGSWSSRSEPPTFGMKKTLILFVCFSVLYFLPFICIVVLLCNVHFNVIFNIAMKAEGLTCQHKQVQPTIFFFKCPVPSQENGHCYIIVRFCVCYIWMLSFYCVVVLLLYLMRFPLFLFLTCCLYL